MKRAAALAMTILLLTGCQATQPKVTLTSTFDPNEAAYINAAGSGSISGEAFLKTVGGDVKTAAGNNVELVPATRYARERIAAIYNGGACARQAVDFGAADPNYMRMTRRTVADAQGKFRFDGLAAGDYYIITFVIWGAPSQYGISQQGCSLNQLVSLRDGESKSVILTGM